MGLVKSRGNMYPWVTHTWNPIKGHCGFECSYCYVKTSGRLKQYQVPCYLEEKELKTNLGKGRTIFIGSMTDMWGPWVEDDMIMPVLKTCLTFPLNTYIFQSKDPSRFLRFKGYFYLLDHFCLGTTIETDHYWEKVTDAPIISERVEAMREVERVFWGNIFVTIEPIVDFNLEYLSEILATINPRFVTIGADSKGHGLAEPPWEKVEALIERLGKLGIEIREKKNLDRLKK